MFYKFKSDCNIRRKTPCCICCQTDGALVGRINYFDLETMDFVQCPSCGLISVDPIPDIKIVSQGCSMLYKHQQGKETKKRILKGFGRSYRKGALFARQYLKTIPQDRPINILEVGAGDGYFAQGIKSIYSNAEVTYLDVVDDLVKYYKEHFDCSTVCGAFDSESFGNKKYDLIIARDLFEHLLDPMKFLYDAKSILKKDGFLFIITPNGKEEFWLINQKFTKQGSPTNVLLNHFYYFLPETLDVMFSKAGLSKFKTFKFDLNGYKMGLGHKDFTYFDHITIPEIEKVENSPIDEKWSHNPNDVMNNVLNNGSIISRIYSNVKDVEKKPVDFIDSKGHEFFIMLQND